MIDGGCTDLWWLFGHIVVAVLVAGCTWLCGRPRQQRRNFRNMRHMLDSAVGSAVIVRGFTVVTANEAAVRTFGFASKPELEGQDLSVLLHEPDALLLQSEFAEHERSGNAAIFTARGAVSPRLHASPPCRPHTLPTLRPTSHPCPPENLGFDRTRRKPPDAATYHLRVFGAVRVARSWGLTVNHCSNAVVTGRCQNGAELSLSLFVSPAAVRGDYVVWMRGRVDMMARQQAELMLNDVLGALESLAEPVIAMKGHIILSVNEATLTTFGYTFVHIDISYIFVYIYMCVCVCGMYRCIDSVCTYVYWSYRYR